MAANRRAGLALIDADGTLYNTQYHTLLILLIYKYHDFALQYVKPRPLLAEEISFVKVKSEEIIYELKNTPCEVLLAEFENLKEIIFPTISKLFLNAYAINLKKHPYANSEIQELLNAVDSKALLAYGKYSFIKNFNKLNEGILQTLLITASQNLCLSLREAANDLDYFSIGVGSARQSKQFNEFANEYCGTNNLFFDLIYLESFLTPFIPNKHFNLSKLLLADVYGNLLVGESYQRIIERAEHHSPSVLDETKFSIIYAHAHEFAQLHEHEPKELALSFYDDRQDILETLHTIFFRYPDILPAMTLRLCRFTSQLETTFTVTMTGTIDYHYPKSLVEMARACGHDFKDFRKGIDIARDFQFEGFIAQRKAQPTWSGFVGRFHVARMNEPIPMSPTIQPKR